jgi:hypothetical protein
VHGDETKTREAEMETTQVAVRLREQLERFSGIFSPRFSKPQARFIKQVIYGIQASQDVKISAISRELGEGIALKKTAERLSHHLQAEGMGQQINEAIVAYAAARVHSNTLIVVDPTDVRKSYARRMPYLAHVRDGSSGELVPGYWGCLAVACEAGSRRVIPLHQRLWSAQAPDFVSENTQLLQIIDTIRKGTQGRGIYVMDRGGDRICLFEPLLERSLRFIVRLTGDRDLCVRGRPRRASELAEGCPMMHAETVIKQDGDHERPLHLEYGFRAVRLPEREEQLYLVVVRGFGVEPLMLLTNVEVLSSRKSVWFIVQSYLTRWLVEETIRFIKQSYHLEDLRVLDYERLKNLMALVLAAVVFSAVWLGESLKLAVLKTRVAAVSKRLFGVPDFHYYALADGIANLFSRLGKWASSFTPQPKSSDHQLSFLLSTS